MTQQLIERLVHDAHRHLIGVQIAVLPVQGDEALVDLLEQGKLARVAGVEVLGGVDGGRSVRERPPACDRPFEHAHLETTVIAQLHLVAEAGDEKEAAAVIGEGIGLRLAVEGSSVEAAAPVCDLGDQIATLEAHGDLDVVLAAAVADGVGGGLLDAEHDVVDELALRAVLAQVVAQTLASAQQVGRLGCDREVKARQCRADDRLAGHVPPYRTMSACQRTARRGRARPLTAGSDRDPHGGRSLPGDESLTRQPHGLPLFGSKLHEIHRRRACCANFAPSTRNVAAI